MKKLLLITTSLILSTSLFAQVYSPASGSITTSTTIDFTFPSSTTIDLSGFGLPAIPGLPSSINASISNVNLSVTGLPAGVSADCSISTCDFGPGVAGTITFSGTPTESGVFTVNIVSLTSGTTDALPIVGAVTFPGSAGGQSIPAAPQVFDGGPYTMSTTSAVQELSTSSFDVIQNIPNPFSGNTTIKFSTPIAGNVDFKVFDMIGKVVYASKIQAQAKTNTINFSADKLTAGTYFYSLSNGTKTITKKMIVSGK